MSEGHRVVEMESLPGGEDAVRFEGHAHGASISSFVTQNLPGAGPGLHTHPYEEVFFIVEGLVRFTVGCEEVEGEAGQIVVVPPETPHKFVNIGEERLRMVTIHPRERMETEWLE